MLRVIAVYVLLGWVLIRVSDGMAQSLAVPDVISKAIAVLVLLGLPV